MAGITGFQDFWVSGARVLFKRDDVDGTEQPLRDLGVVQEISPTLEVNRVELKDSDGGIAKVVCDAVTSQDEEHDITLSNLNCENLALLFLSDPCEDLTQVASGVVDSPQPNGAILGHLYALHEPDGTRIRNLASIDAVKDSTGATTFVLDTDFEVASLDRGLIRLLSGGAITPGDKLLISYTRNGFTGKRRIRPLSGQGSIQGELEIYFGRQGNTLQTVRIARASVTPVSMTIPQEEFASFMLKFAILSDIADEETPAGTLDHFLGSVPTDS